MFVFPMKIDIILKLGQLLKYKSNCAVAGYVPGAVIGEP